MDYKKSAIRGELELPDVPAEKAKISVPWAIFGIVFSITMTALLLGFPHIIQGYFPGTGWVHVFDIEVLRGMWLFLILWAGLEIFVEIVSLMAGHYSKHLAAVGVTSGILQIGFAIIVFGNAAIINPDFVSAITSAVDGYAPEIVSYVRPHLWILAVCIVAIFIETVDTLWHSFRAAK
jgi:hypothetical protein